MVITDAEVRREILELASEDNYGLYELLWALNRAHPTVPLEIKRAAAQSAVVGLIQDGGIVLLRLRWGTGEALAIPAADWRAVLENDESWVEGEEYIGFGSVRADAGHQSK